MMQTWDTAFDLQKGGRCTFKEAELPLKKAGLHTKNVERHGKKAGLKDETNEVRLHKKKAELHRTHN